MWNQQSLKQKRLQFSNLRTERGVINITVRDVVFCGMLLRCLSKNFVTESLIEAWNVTATAASVKEFCALLIGMS